MHSKHGLTAAIRVAVEPVPSVADYRRPHGALSLPPGSGPAIRFSGCVLTVASGRQDATYEDSEDGMHMGLWVNLQKAQLALNQTAALLGRLDSIIPPA